MTKGNSAKQVDRVLAEAERQTKTAIAEFNQRAAELVSRGKYPTAEHLMQAAISMKGFRARIREFRNEWRQLLGGVRWHGNAKSKAPLWEYYQPILTALAGLDGKATRGELEQSIEPMLPAELKQSNNNTAGTDAWKKKIRRARRPMIKEGFLEPGAGKMWKLTAEGKQAASAKAESSTRTPTSQAKTVNHVEPIRIFHPKTNS